jgi:hypothetical protein
MDVGHRENIVLYTQVGQGTASGNDLGHRLATGADVDDVEHSTLDVIVRPPDGIAMMLQHVELVTDYVGAHAGEQIARVAILGDEAQGFLLAPAADQDGRMRLGERLRAVERLSQSKMSAGIRRCLARPHLFGNLQSLLQPLESFLERRERHAEAAGFTREPRRANPQVGPPEMTSRVEMDLTRIPGWR